MVHFSSYLEHHSDEIHDWIRRNCAIASTKLNHSFHQANTLLARKDINPKHLIYAILALVTLAWTTSLLTRRLLSRKKPVSRPRTPDLEKRSTFKTPAREPGGMLFHT
jgi:hypothetical protein